MLRVPDTADTSVLRFPITYSLIMYSTNATRLTNLVHTTTLICLINTYRWTLITRNERSTCVLCLEVDEATRLVKPHFIWDERPIGVCPFIHAASVPCCELSTSKQWRSYPTSILLTMLDTFDLKVNTFNTKWHYNSTLECRNLLSKSLPMIKIDLHVMWLL